MRGHVVVTAADARVLATEVLGRSGLDVDSAALVADHLVWCEARGTESHGLLRLPAYVDRLLDGSTNATPEFRMIRERAALAVIDADRAQGQVALDVATKKAAEMAREAGIAWVAMRNTTHAGSIGHYARQLAEQHLVGVVLGASRPTMAYHGAREVGVGTNPLAVAVPARNGRLLSFDMATSNASRGRVKLHAAAGRPLEPGWALTADGQPTTDPAEAAVLTALGGPKGSGLSLMIEAVASVLAGSPLVAPTLRGEPGGHGQNAVVMALEIETLTDLPTFLDDIDALIARIGALPTAAGVDEVLLPGERGDRLASARLATGIPLQRDTWMRVTRLAERLDLTPPATWPTGDDA